MMFRHIQTIATIESNSRRAAKETYTAPFDFKGGNAKEISDFLFNHRRTFKESDAAEILAGSIVVREIHAYLVPDHVSEDDFWTRYQFRCNKERIMKQLEKEDPAVIKKRAKSLDIVKSRHQNRMPNSFKVAAAAVADSDRKSSMQGRASFTAIQLKARNELDSAPKLQEKQVQPAYGKILLKSRSEHNSKRETITEKEESSYKNVKLRTTSEHSPRRSRQMIKREEPPYKNFKLKTTSDHKSKSYPAAVDSLSLHATPNRKKSVGRESTIQTETSIEKSEDQTYETRTSASEATNCKSQATNIRIRPLLPTATIEKTPKRITRNELIEERAEDETEDQTEERMATASKSTKSNLLTSNIRIRPVLLTTMTEKTPKRISRDELIESRAEDASAQLKITRIKSEKAMYESCDAVEAVTADTPDRIPNLGDSRDHIITPSTPKYLEEGQSIDVGLPPSIWKKTSRQKMDCQQAIQPNVNDGIQPPLDHGTKMPNLADSIAFEDGDALSSCRSQRKESRSDTCFVTAKHGTILNPRENSMDSQRHQLQDQLALFKEEIAALHSEKEQIERDRLLVKDQRSLLAEEKKKLHTEYTLYKKNLSTMETQRRVLDEEFQYLFERREALQYYKEQLARELELVDMMKIELGVIKDSISQEKQKIEEERARAYFCELLVSHDDAVIANGISQLQIELAEAELEFMQLKKTVASQEQSTASGEATAEFHRNSQLPEESNEQSLDSIEMISDDTPIAHHTSEKTLIDPAIEQKPDHRANRSVLAPPAMTSATPVSANHGDVIHVSGAGPENLPEDVVISSQDDGPRVYLTQDGVNQENQWKEQEEAPCEGYQPKVSHQPGAEADGVLSLNQFLGRTDSVAVEKKNASAKVKEQTFYSKLSHLARQENETGERRLDGTDLGAIKEQNSFKENHPISDCDTPNAQSLEASCQDMKRSNILMEQASLTGFVVRTTMEIDQTTPENRNAEVNVSVTEEHLLSQWTQTPQSLEKNEQTSTASCDCFLQSDHMSGDQLKMDCTHEDLRSEVLKANDGAKESANVIEKKGKVVDERSKTSSRKTKAKKHKSRSTKESAASASSGKRKKKRSLKKPASGDVSVTSDSLRRSDLLSSSRVLSHTDVDHHRCPSIKTADEAVEILSNEKKSSHGNEQLENGPVEVLPMVYEQAQLRNSRESQEVDESKKEAERKSSIANLKELSPHCAERDDEVIGNHENQDEQCKEDSTQAFVNKNLSTSDKADEQKDGENNDEKLQIVDQNIMVGRPSTEVDNVNQDADAGEKSEKNSESDQKNAGAEALFATGESHTKLLHQDQPASLSSGVLSLAFGASTGPSNDCETTKQSADETLEVSSNEKKSSLHKLSLSHCNEELENGPVEGLFMVYEQAQLKNSRESQELDEYKNEAKRKSWIANLNESLPDCAERVDEVIGNHENHDEQCKEDSTQALGIRSLPTSGKADEQKDGENNDEKLEIVDQNIVVGRPSTEVDNGNQDANAGEKSKQNSESDQKNAGAEALFATGEGRTKLLHQDPRASLLSGVLSLAFGTSTKKSPAADLSEKETKYTTKHSSVVRDDSHGYINREKEATLSNTETTALPNTYSIQPASADFAKQHVENSVVPSSHGSLLDTSSGNKAAKMQAEGMFSSFLGAGFWKLSDTTTNSICSADIERKQNWEKNLREIDLQVESDSIEHFLCEISRSPDSLVQQTITGTSSSEESLSERKNAKFDASPKCKPQLSCENEKCTDNQNEPDDDAFSAGAQRFEDQGKGMDVDSVQYVVDSESIGNKNGIPMSDLDPSTQMLSRALIDDANIAGETGTVGEAQGSEVTDVTEQIPQNLSKLNRDAKRA